MLAWRADVTECPSTSFIVPPESSSGTRNDSPFWPQILCSVFPGLQRGSCISLEKWDTFPTLNRATPPARQESSCRQNGGEPRLGHHPGCDGLSADRPNQDLSAGQSSRPCGHVLGGASRIHPHRRGQNIRAQGNDGPSHAPGMPTLASHVGINRKSVPQHNSLPQPGQSLPLAWGL